MQRRRWPDISLIKIAATKRHRKKVMPTKMPHGSFFTGRIRPTVSGDVTHQKIAIAEAEWPKW